MGSFMEKYRSYFIVFIVFVELFIVCGTTYDFNVIFTSIQREFDAGAGVTGWVGSLALALMFCNPLSPPLIRLYGPRVVTLAGTVIFTCGLAATSFVPDLAFAFVTFGVLVGVGSNFVYQSGVELVLDWFPYKNCSRATSVALLGTSLCVLVFAPLLNVLIAAYGWRNALLITAGGCFTLSVSLGVFIVPPPKGENPATDENAGTVEEGGPSPDEGARSAAESAEGGCGEIEESQFNRLKLALCQLDVWLLVLAYLLSNLCWAFFVINFGSFLEYDLHFTTDQITSTLVLGGVGECLGKILFSVFVFGPIRGVAFVVPCSAAMEVFGDFGADIVTVLVLVPIGLGSTVGAPFAGGLYDLMGGYKLSLLINAGLFVCSAINIIILLVRRSGKTRTWQPPSANSKLPIDNPAFVVESTDL
ncbi:monocarboxylate transporter 13-like [Acanthaster planci]|uniref:Monocarboxylate transporter 13-like n=1 Tax=Acanthaster planci TaxID=133434 RepID=A0A8B7YDN2_ACAPL|nr:monocarboxylate transporter 13-like [Acanthaster planci]